MLDTVQKSRPSLVVRPTTIKPATPQQQPQIIVIPQSMLSGNGIKTLFHIANNNSSSESQIRPTLTRVIKPTVPIVKSPMETNRTISLKRPLPQASPPHYENSCSGSDDDSKNEDHFVDENGLRVRKRANLDHLSMEEKMMRRKLKNRVAAQNARDKKRMKMDEMEITIKKLQQQNRALAQQNEKLLALNRRLMAENEGLKSNTTLTTAATTTTLTTTAFIKEEEMPYSPESLPPPSSHSPPLSCDEDDEIMMSTAMPLEAVDMSSVPVSNPGAIAAIAERRSSVFNRLLVPAEPSNVLQQQGQSRSQAVERITSQSTAATAPEQLACLLWMCLLNPSGTSQTTSQIKPEIVDVNQPEQTTTTTTSSRSETSSSMSVEKNSNLPPKKRGVWWGSHQPCPHAKT